MDPLYFGILGGTLFIMAWLYESYEEVFKQKMYEDLKFAYMNIVGVGFIIIYSFYINDILFLYLNIVLFFFIAFEIIYSKYMVHKKKSRKSK